MNICVYGASSSAIDQSYVVAAERLGNLIASHGHGLVFGGGAHGLMGAVARGARSAGGRITGVAPTFFNADGVLFNDCDRLIRTETMHERKMIMENMSDAFIALPGGMGTFEEFFETLTLKQLGRHRKAIVLLSTDGYYGHLEQMMRASVERRFMDGAALGLYTAAATPEEAVEQIENYTFDGFEVLTRMKGVKTE